MRTQHGCPPSYVRYFGKVLSARVTIEVVKELLGFSEDDLRILMSKKHLKPSGKPRPNSTKYFATAYIMRLASDEKWINKATEICQTASNQRSDAIAKKKQRARDRADDEWPVPASRDGLGPSCVKARG